MKLARTYLLGFLVFSALVGCGDDEDSDSTADVATTANGHCTVENASGFYLCIDFAAWSTTGLEAAQTDCEGANWGVAGTWTADALCSATTIGSCALTAGSDAYTIHYTQVPDGSDAATNCTDSMGGTYTAASLNLGPDGWLSSDD